MNFTPHEIVWLDSRRPTSEWVYFEDHEFLGAVKVTSYGLVIRETMNTLFLAQNMVQAKEGIQVSGVLAIPVVAILSRTILAKEAPRHE